jgi:hypothetical protein
LITLLSLVVVAVARLRVVAVVLVDSELEHCLLLLALHTRSL